MIAFWQESYDKYVNSVLKSNDIRLPTKDCVVKAIVFPVIMHSCVRLFATPWNTAHQTSLSITNTQNLPKLMSIESVTPSNHLIPCCPLLLLPSIFPNIRSFQMSQLFALGAQVPKVLEF